MLHLLSSIMSIRFYRMMSLFFMLSCVRLIHWDSHTVSGFEMSPRYNPPKILNVPTNDQHQTVSNIEAQSSKSLSSRCKYDLGLGKNAPLLANNDDGHRVGWQMTEEREQLDQNTSSARNFDDNDNSNGTTYEACRFLVEHETARTYPAPDDNSGEDHKTKDRKDDCFPRHPFQTFEVTTKFPNGNEDRNARKLKPAAKRITKKTPFTFVRSRKSQHPAKVQPKRFLEDCLTISDHELSDSAASTSSGKSTIWSRPDTPQLDMNSVWVEMLLHNQMTQTQVTS